MLPSIMRATIRIPHRLPALVRARSATHRGDVVVRDDAVDRELMAVRPRTRRRGSAPVLAVLLAAAVACRGPEADATITGIVTRGPICPVVVEGQPCPDAPTAATVRVLDRTSGDQVAVAEAGGDGQFTVAVPAGDLVLDVTAEGAMSCPPMELTIGPQGITEVVVACDTGIR